MRAGMPHLRTEAPRRAVHVLVTICAAGFATRLGASVLLPSIVWPDEIFQSLEQAHRVVFGTGIVPWEFRAGARSWILPGSLVPVMWVGQWFGPLGHDRAAQVVLGVVSLAPVAFAFALTRSRAGLAAATAAAVVCASWFELVYFAPKALSEVVAAHFLLAGLAVTHLESDERRGGVLAGVLLTFAVALRMHLAPAVLVAAAWICFRRRVRWLPVAGGGAAVTVLAALVDLATWSVPLKSYWRNFQLNVLESRSAEYGLVPWYGYFRWMGDQWGWATLPIVALAALGGRRHGAVAAAAVTVLTVHSAFGHKEYRFIYPAIVLVIVLAALGTAELVAALSERGFDSRAVALGASVAWIALSAGRAARFESDGSFGHASAGESMWSLKRSGLEAMSYAGADPALCGIGLVNVDWAWTGGYTWLHRDVPLFHVGSADEFTELTPAFNVLLTEPSSASAFPRYEIRRCWSDLCVLRRPGGCNSGSHPDINAQLRRAGQ